MDDVEEEVDNLDTEDLFGGTSTEASEDTHDTSIPTRSDSSMSFAQQRDRLVTALEQFASRATQEIPSRSLIRNLLSSITNSEELFEALDLAKSWTSNVYYRSRALAPLQVTDANLLGTQCEALLTLGIH